MTWTVTDVHGNTNTDTQDVTVNDTEAPTITAAADVTVENDASKCSAEVVLTAPSTGDNCGVQSVTNDAPAAFPVGTTTVTWTITDVHGNTNTDTQDVTVTNNTPVITSVSSSDADGVFPINTLINLNIGYTDNNVVSAKINWDDGNAEETIYGSTFSIPHTYAAAGVYSVNVVLTDACGATASYLLEYLVTYDPSAGFVTGGGWISSPAGAYLADPTLTGKATFGFVSKYQKGATVPTGNTEFQFQVGNLNFKSTSYQWLVVSGQKAQYKGYGTVNGSGNYQFLITAIDGTTDQFRIKINGIYDNALNAAEDSDVATPISAGSIVVHTPNAKSSTKRDGAPEEVTKEISDVALSVYPNPIGEVIYVKYASESESPIGMQLFDLNGRSLKMETYQAIPTGEYEMPVSNLNMNTGFYLLRIAQDKSTKTIKLFKK